MQAPTPEDSRAEKAATRHARNHSDSDSGCTIDEEHFLLSAKRRDPGYDEENQVR